MECGASRPSSRAGTLAQQAWIDRSNNHAISLPNSLLLPGPSAVGAAPEFVVTGGNFDLRRAAHIPAAHMDVSYVRGKGLAFDRGLHLNPGYTAVGGVEKRTRLPAGPYSVVVTRVAQQWMIRAHSVLPALAAVGRPLQDAPGDRPGDIGRQSRARRGR